MPNALKKVVGETKKELFSVDEFSKSLKSSIQPVDTLDSVFRKQRNLLSLGKSFQFVYQSNDYRPFWLEEKGVSEAAQSLLNDLDSLRDDGLDLEKYNVAALKNQFNNLKNGQGDFAACIAFDTSCTKSYLAASRDLLLGILRPKSVDSLWYHTNDSFWNAPKTMLHSLAQEGKYIPLSEYRSKIPTYSLLRNECARFRELAGDQSFIALKNSITKKKAPDSIVSLIIKQEMPWVNGDDSAGKISPLVRSFQYFYGLAPTGKIDSTTNNYLARMPDTMLNFIRINMERIRWMPVSFETQYVLVDVPLMELLFRKNGDDSFHMRVVVGKTARQTPSLNANMANVVFSPSWGVPPTILKKDVLPGLQKKNSNYLARKGLHAFDRKGNEISSSKINEDNYRNYTFRQPPGARNSLGEVKFNLPNKWDIYLHDTPHKEDFPRRYRAKSSGCVRVEHPREFAEFILKNLEGRDFDQGKIDTIIQTRKTRYEILKKKIPVHIVYLTAFEDSTNQHIRYLTDIYSRDRRVLDLLDHK